MKKYPKLHKPENYILTENDFEDTEDYDDLLEHLTDVPASEPLRKVKINNIGIFDQKTTIYIEDMFHSNKYIPVLCSINVDVDLSENRGIHMSRSIQSIFSLSSQKFKTLDSFAAELANMVKERQESNTCTAEVTGTYINTRHTRKTGLESQDQLQLLSVATASDQETKVKTGMKVFNMTACPCTKTFTKYSIVPSLKAMGISFQQIKQLLELTSTGTHTQLGTTKLLIDKEKTDLSHRDIYDVIDQSTFLVYELMKRPDEHDFVQRVIKKPQFTEDVAREVTYNAYQQWKETLSPQAEISVESMLQDSIHIHNVRSIVTNTFGAIKADLD